ncbi:MAG: HAMP domain-containing sensor histidine kinase [Bdellovibrionota bacterium]
MENQLAKEFEKISKAVELDSSAKTARKALQLGLDARFEGEAQQWTTAPGLPGWAEIVEGSRPARANSGARVGLHFGRPFFAKEIAGGKLILFSSFNWRPSPMMDPRFWEFLLAQVCGVLIITYLILLWQLRPIKRLSGAIEELSKGNLSYRLPVRGSDEFARLSQGFNEMAETVNEMIQSKEELLLGVSHELRSPLASANVLLELIGDEKRKQQIRTHLNRMDALVSELLESHRLSGKHTGFEFSSTNIGELLQGVCGRYSQAGQPVECQPPSTVEAEVDRRYFERLLTNLLENALKYSKDSGKSVEVGLVDIGEKFEVSVRDYGPGIAQSELENIFEPFYRVDKSRTKSTGGFGLGLYLCAKIAHFHNGTIVASNPPKGGCLFVARLPKKQSDRQKLVS